MNASLEGLHDANSGMRIMMMTFPIHCFGMLMNNDGDEPAKIRRMEEMLRGKDGREAFSDTHVIVA